ncbi:unnamed protein product, partial [Polarella glacialis]
GRWGWGLVGRRAAAMAGLGQDLAEIVGQYGLPPDLVQIFRDKAVTSTAVIAKTFQDDEQFADFFLEEEAMVASGRGLLGRKSLRLRLALKMVYYDALHTARNNGEVPRVSDSLVSSEAPSRAESEAEVHLDTCNDESAAQRFDVTWDLCSAALARRKAKKATVTPDSAQCPVEESAPLLACSDLPIPKGLFDVPWYYDEKWHARAMSAHMISTATFLARTPLWSCTPRLRRYREVLPEEGLVQKTGSILAERGEPAVLCVEKPYLDGFVAGLAQSVSVPFVLLAVNGGDAPLTPELQERISELPGIKACFAMNLQRPQRPDLFFPLPIGLPHHADGLHRGNLRGACDADALIRRIRQAGPAWKLRDPRLLITPMQGNRLRNRYLEVLAKQEYRHLVRIVSERLDFESFLTLLSEHQSTLSPPGKGYDCYRTWQAVAVGTVPVVVYDALFDARLYRDSGLPFIPQPDELTADALEKCLATLADPASLWQRLEVGYWATRWSSHLTQKK